MQMLSDLVYGKARDSSIRHLANTYNVSTLTEDPLNVSKSVYSLWKKSSKNKQYIVASKKIQKVVKQLGNELSILKQELRQIEKTSAIREVEKQMKKKPRRVRFR